MPIDLTSYKGRVNPYGIISKNSYEVTISGMSEDVTMFCLAAQLPGMTMGVASAFFQGRQLKLAGDPRYPNWSATFYANSAQSTIETYKAFLDWYNLPRHQVTNVGKRDAQQYWKTVTIKPLAADRTTVVSKIELIDAFVTEIQPIDISYESENELLTFNVILEFSETTVEGSWGASGLANYPSNPNIPI
jgi:hypothetical protein